MIPYSIKSSADVQVEILSDDKLKSRRKKASGATLRTADVQVEILSDDKLKSRRKKASGATLRTACLSQSCLTVGDNQSSLTPRHGQKSPWTIIVEKRKCTTLH